MARVPGQQTTDDASSLPLLEGDHGEAVADLQHRLGELGFAPDDAPGDFGPATAVALRTFQARRGLPVDGTCDRHTWAAIVEAGYRIGDRLLYRRTPMLRGDDVAELQRRLSTLGFDTGRVDAIFGDQTVVALMDFQRNVGLPADGICGRRTLEELMRLQTREGGTDLVSPLRERLRIAANGHTSLEGRRIGVGERGGFGSGVVAICRLLREAGATALAIQHPDPSHQAAEANASGLDCFVALVIAPESTACTTAYYSGFRYESVASRRLAELAQARLPGALGLDDGGIRGMSLPALRETRMPAIEVELGAPATVVQRTAALAQAVLDALAEWVDTSWE